jgi:hypothetical protein
LKSIKEYFTEQPNSGLKTVKLVLFDQPTVDAFLGTWM